MTPDTRTTRRTAVAALAAGAASVALLAPRPALAAMSSAAGIVAGGSVAGPNGASQFSAFGSRLELDDSEEPVFFCALSWYDPAGADDGGPLAIEFESVASYGPTDVDGERLMTGTVAVNGEGGAPFTLLLFDGGSLGDDAAAPDTVHLTVGSLAVVGGTPVAGETTDFSYDVYASLETGNIQIIALEM